MTHSSPELNAFANALAQVIPDYFGDQAFTLSCLSLNEQKITLTLPFVINGLLADGAPATSALNDICAGKKLQWQVKYRIPSVQGQPEEGIKNLIAVASGKGGVGKSTTAVSLAFALAKEGAKVGILDADVFGPSVPILLNTLDAKPPILANDKIQPVTVNFNTAQGDEAEILSMSIGNLVPAENATVWRGPMASRALQQMYNDTHWQALDYLIVDMPPGTGDIQLTLSQTVPVTGAVIVTTPQDIALLDARKAYKMFEKVQVPVFGVVENMSTHVCSQCGHEESIFGEDGAKKMADDYGLDVLGQIPLQMSIREQADGGHPTVAAEPESKTAKNYRDIALRVAGKLSSKKKDFSAAFPNIVVEST